MLFNEHLLLIARRSLGPLIQMSVHIAVIATESRVEDLIRDIKGINERDSLSPDVCQQ